MRMVQYSKYITITLHNDLIVLDIYCILVVFILLYLVVCTWHSSVGQGCLAQCRVRECRLARCDRGLVVVASSVSLVLVAVRVTALSGSLLGSSSLSILHSQDNVSHHGWSIYTLIATIVTWKVLFVKVFFLECWSFCGQSCSSLSASVWQRGSLCWGERSVCLATSHRRRVTLLPRSSALFCTVSCKTLRQHSRQKVFICYRSWQK